MSGAANEWNALLIFVRAWTFADKQQLGIRVAIAEDNFVAAFKGELTAGPVANLLSNGVEGRRSSLERDDGRGCCASIAPFPPRR